MEDIHCSNAHEKFMLMLLERIETIEDQLTGINDKMSIVMGSLSPSGCMVVFNLSFSTAPSNETASEIFEYLNKELSCEQCFFSSDNSKMQAVFNRAEKFDNITEIIHGLKTRFSFSVSQLSITSHVDLCAAGKMFMMQRHPTKISYKALV
jgi:hypothetical protein